MSSYRLTPRALRDLDQIADYTLSQWGDRQAKLYLGKLAKRFDWLGKNPNAGRIGDDIGHGYRSCREGSHLIFYIVGRGVVAIIDHWRPPRVDGHRGVFSDFELMGEDSPAPMKTSRRIDARPAVQRERARSRLLVAEPRPRRPAAGVRGALPRTAVVEPAAKDLRDREQREEARRVLR